jgi:F0F1-type ATP synthase membrane subunit a
MINLTAGHLILSLVALAQSNNISVAFTIVGAIMFLFILLEIAVAFIQSYVFRMLTLLYSKEN